MHRCHVVCSRPSPCQSISSWAFLVFLSHAHIRGVPVSDVWYDPFFNNNNNNNNLTYLTYCRGGHKNNNNNNNIIFKTMFMVLSSWQSHCESSLGSFDEYRTAPSGRQPKTKPDDLRCESACTGCQSLHPPSKFIIITQPES